MALTLAVFFGMTSLASAAVAGTKTVIITKPLYHHHLHGVVVAVVPGAVKNHGDIQVKVHHHHHVKKAKTAAATAVAKKKKHPAVVTLHVTSKTKYEKVIHSQGVVVQRLAATPNDVVKGSHVHVAFTHHNHHARRVHIHLHVQKAKVTVVKKKPVVAKPKKKK